jgi:catechol 2,3-dioxygenase-like lactoylglutathione lyase family enzyme
MKTLCLLGLLVLPGLATASPESKGPVLESEGTFFALSVSNLAASTAWYRDKLGLRVVMEVPPQGGTAVTILEGDGLIVELLQRDGARPPAGDAQLTHGFFKAGILVKDLDRTLARLRERGVEIAFGPYPASDTQRANLILRDNSGNLIQLFGERPKEP